MIHKKLLVMHPIVWVLISDTIVIEPRLRKTKETSTTLSQTTAHSTTTMKEKVDVSKRIPRIEMVTDMPAIYDDIPDYYDYSHFDYVNKK